MIIRRHVKASAIDMLHFFKLDALKHQYWLSYDYRRKTLNF